MNNKIFKITTLSFLLVLSSCGDKNTASSNVDTAQQAQENDDIQVTKSQFEQGKMTLGNLEDRPFPTVVTVNGMIDVPPEHRAMVNAIMGGYIKTTPLLVGDQVRKGALVATLENPEFITLQQEYMMVHEQLTYLKSEYDRQVLMKAENITSQKSFLKAESDYKTAVAKHTGLDKQLRMLNISPSAVQDGKISAVVPIYAPIAGSITHVNVTKGSYVSPATNIVEIINTEHIHLELSVYEKDILKIKKDQAIEFKIPESSTETYKAEVHLVGTSIDENRRVKVHGHIENETATRFLTGMFVEGQIITESTLAKALPSEAIVVINDLPYVLALIKKEGDTYYFEQTEVSIKESYDGFTVIELTNGNNDAQQFLTKGAFNLLAE